MDDRYQIIQEFEKKLSRNWLWAYVAGILHKAAIWLGSAAITWATVVLMGGFSSALAISDFITITLLVLLIIMLLAVALFTCKLVTKKNLSTGSLQPLKLVYQDKFLVQINFIKCFFFLVQCIVLAFIFWVSASFISRSKLHLGSFFSSAFSNPDVDSAAGLDLLRACLQSCATSHDLTTAFALQTCVQFCFPAQNSTDTATTNLEVSLFTFHSLVIVTCALVSLCNIYILCRVAQAWWLMYSSGPKTLSLTRYHDKVLSRILNDGLLDADEFDATEFLIRGVGEDLVGRKIAPLEVKRQNEDFIKYLLYHPQGVERVMGMLASEDILLQQTAANMPGFWSSEHKGMKKDGMELLSQLGVKLGLPGKVAEGAANSFKSLAVAWSGDDPSPLLKVYVSRSEGQGQSTSSGKSSDIPVLASGEVAPSGSVAPVGWIAGGGESRNGMSRYEGGMEGGGASTDAISRSGGGRDSAGSGSGGAKSSNAPSSAGGVEKEDSMQRSSKSEAAEEEGSGSSESSQTIASPEGGERRGPSQSGEGEGPGCKSSDVVSVSEDLGGGAGEWISIPPRSGDHTTSTPGGEGQRGAVAGHTTGGGLGDSSKASGQGRRHRGEVRTGQVVGTRGSDGKDELKWNVVQKVVDLVANQRVPTLQVYVRTLDAFFMSKSIRESLTEEEKKQIKSKLLRIVQGTPNQASGARTDQASRSSGGSGLNQASGATATATADYVRIGIDSSTKARTRLLAFSALERLGLDPHINGGQLLQELDDHLNQVPEESVIWIEEVKRYDQLCLVFQHGRGKWLTSEKWKIQGIDFS